MASIKKNFLYSSILTTSNYIFPLLVYPYVSRVLGVSRIGACNFVDSIITYFILFSMFGITSIGIREIAKAKSKGDNLDRIFSSLFTLNAIFTLVSSLILICVTIFVPSLVPYRKLLFIGLVKVISNFFLIDWLFRGLEDFRYITIRTILVKCLYVSSIFIFIKDESDYVLYYLLTVLMITVNSILNETYARKYVKLKFDNIKIFQFLTPVLIMGVYSVMTSMYTTFNTAYLGFAAGDVEVGYYSTSNTLYGALLAFFSAFTSVMLPRMSSIIAEGDLKKFRHYLSRSVNVLFSFAIPFVLLFVVFSPEIILLYAGKGFEGAIIPMRITMPLIIIIGYEQIIITQGLLPLDKNKSVLINSVFGAITGIVFSIILVGTFKSIGSAMVWVLSEFVVFISANYFVNKYIQFRFPIILLFKELVVYLPLFVILFLIHKLELSAFLGLILAGFSTVIYTFFVQYFVLKQKDFNQIINSFFKHT